MNSFACKYCNKEYSSKQSRSNHYYLYHNKNDNHKDNHINHPDNHKHNHNNHLVTQEKEKDIRCRKCNKIFTFVQNRWRHEKTCDNNKIGKLEEQNKELVNKLNKLESKVKELSKKPSAININNTMNNIGTVGTVNNINSLGYENIRNNISEKDKMYILTSIMHEEHPITELVRKIYTDEKLKNERNTLLTNLRSKDCLIYKSETKNSTLTTPNKNSNFSLKSAFNTLSLRRKKSRKIKDPNISKDAEEPIYDVIDHSKMNRDSMKERPRLLTPTKEISDAIAKYPDLRNILNQIYFHENYPVIE